MKVEGSTAGFFVMVTGYKRTTSCGGRVTRRRQKSGKSGRQFTEFTPEHLAFYENTTVFLSSQRETTRSERRGNRRIEITVETHNNLRAHSALF